MTSVLNPAGMDELQKVITTAKEKKVKVLLKENVDFNSMDIDENTLVLDISKLDKIIDLDKENFTVTVEGGINFLEFQNLLWEKGFYFPIDTYASGHTSLSYNVLHSIPSYSLGGYGNYREYLLGIEAILFNGNYIKVGGKNIKNVSGLDLIGLLAGSKETLGLITSLTLRLLPRPEEKRVFICTFESLELALRAAGELSNSKINPAKIFTLNDSGSIFLGDKNPGSLPTIIVEVEGFKASMPRKVNEIKEIAAKYTGKALIELVEYQQIINFWNSFREMQYHLLTKTCNPLSFSSFLTGLQEMVIDLNGKINNSPENVVIIINNIIGKGMAIPQGTPNVKSLTTEFKDIIKKHNGNILNDTKRQQCGINFIQEKIRKVFDPADISYWGVKNYE